MAIHINRFIDRIKATESRGQRDLVMTVTEAKDLHSDITKLLLALNELRAPAAGANDVVTVDLDGGTFK